MGKIRLFYMIDEIHGGHRYEICGNDLVLPVHPSHPDAPQVLNLSSDGNHLTCGTRKMGYYFAWDISRFGEARVLASSRLRSYQVPITAPVISLSWLTVSPRVHQQKC